MTVKVGGSDQRPPQWAQASSCGTWDCWRRGSRGEEAAMTAFRESGINSWFSWKSVGGYATITKRNVTRVLAVCLFITSTTPRFNNRYNNKCHLKNYKETAVIWLVPAKCSRVLSVLFVWQTSKHQIYWLNTLRMSTTKILRFSSHSKVIC